MCPIVQAKFEEVDNLDETKRGKGGFGSTEINNFKNEDKFESSLEELEKQIVLKKIGLAGQKKIFSANVLIIGLGGLGCPLFTYLAASGVGKIGIVDFDKVEISNLNRQTLFNSNDFEKI